MAHNEDALFAEQQVTSGILTGVKEADQVFSLLTGSDFTVAAYRDIFLAASAEYAEKGQYDTGKLLDGEGVLDVFLELNQSTIMCLDIVTFAKRMKVYSRERRIKKRLSQVLTADADSIFAELQAAAEEEGGKVSRDYKGMTEAQMEAVLQEIEGGDDCGRITTGYHMIDFATGGLRQGNISAWGAKPSTGKTALLLNILLRNAKAGKKTAFFSLEMSTTQLWERILANSCGINYGLINKKSLPEIPLRQYKNRLIELAKGGNIYLFDDVFTVEEQGSILYELKPDFAVVDYVQLVRTLQKANSRNEELSNIVSRYKQFARKTNCHIALLSQFNRLGTANRQGDGPSMFNLKDSGSIEDGSDYIFLLSRPAVDNPEEPAETTRIKLQKNKFGIVGACDLYFDGKYQRFTDIARDEGLPWPERKDING